MYEYNAPMARQGIRMLLEHFGTPSDYRTVQKLYLDLCDIITERRVLHEQTDVNEIIVRAFENAWDELHPQLPLPVDD